MKDFNGFGDYFAKQAFNYFATGFAGVVKSNIELMVSSIDKNLKNVNLGASDFGILGPINYWDDIYKSIGGINRELGVAGEMSNAMRDSLQSAYEIGVAYGISIDELTQSYGEMVRQIGVNRLFSPDELNQLADFRAAYGQGFEEIFSTLALYGASIEDVKLTTMDAIKEADELGLNASVYLKELTQNMSLLDRLSFRNGIQGLNRMLQLSQRYKINIESAAQFAQNNRMLPDIMETSARLQVLGGQFSRLGNPFELGFMARNEPDKLFEKLVDVAGAYAMINEEGKAVVSPFGLDMINEMAQITGMQAEQIVQASKIRAIREEIGNQISSEILALNDYEKHVDKIAANAFYDQDRGEYMVNVKVGDQIQAVSVLDLNEDQVNSLSTIGKDTPLEDINKQLIMSNEALSDTMQRLVETFKRFIISENLYKLTSDQLRPIAQQIRTGVGDNPMALGLKTLLDELDQSIFDQIMQQVPTIVEKAEDVTRSMEGYLTSEGIGNDLEELSENIKNLVDFLNGPKDFFTGKLDFGDNLFGDYFGSFFGSLDATSEAIKQGSLTPIIDDMKKSWYESTDQDYDTSSNSIIEIDKKKIGDNYQNLLSQMKQNAQIINHSDKNNKVELTFDEFKGSITINDSSGRPIGEQDMRDIFKKIQPEFEQYFIRMFGSEIENNTKYNPRGKKSTF